MFLLLAQKDYCMYFLPWFLFHSALHKYKSGWAQKLLPNFRKDCLETVHVLFVKVCWKHSFLSLIFFFPSFSLFLSLSLQLSWMWSYRALWKSTPLWQRWSRPKPTWRKSYQTTHGILPVNHHLLPPPLIPPLRKHCPGPFLLVQTCTIRPQPWVKPAVSGPWRCPSTRSLCTLPRLLWSWRQKPIQWGPAWQ